jgi:DHA2 family multidrug resistance protein
MVSNLTYGSPQLSERLNTISQGLAAKTGVDVAGATNQAYAMISSSVDRQAYYLSYLDTFRWIAIFFIIVIPLVGFLRVKKKSAQEAAAAMAAAAEAH